MATAPEPAWSRAEMMVVAAARELAGRRVCFVGVGLPNAAANLAQRTVAPDLELVYESGVFGARPARLPVSVGDPTIVTGATAVTSMLDLFSLYLQGGRIDVGFLGGAQIDPRGTINTTVIGPYDRPTTRLPGSGGAVEIALNAREVFVIMRQSPRSFVERVDFRTSPGRDGASAGRGPTVVITDLAVWRFGPTGELGVASAHVGVGPDELRRSVGWELAVPADLPTTPAPTADELRTLRELGPTLG